MLRLMGTSRPVPVDVWRDDPIPLSVTLGSWTELEPTLWYVTNGAHRSMLEVGLGSQGGAIREVTLLVPGMPALGTLPRWGVVPQEIGLPLCAVDDWPEKGVRTEAGIVQVYMQGQRLSIALSAEGPCREIICGRLRFGVDRAGNLCGIEVGGYDDRDAAHVKSLLQGWAAATRCPDGASG